MTSTATDCALVLMADVRRAAPYPRAIRLALAGGYANNFPRVPEGGAVRIELLHTSRVELAVQSGKAATSVALTVA